MTADHADQLRALSAKFRQNQYKLPAPECAEAEILATEALADGQEGAQLVFSLAGGLPAEAIAGALASRWREWNDAQRQEALGHFRKQNEQSAKRLYLQLSKAIVSVDPALARPLLVRACSLLAPRRDHGPNEKDQSLFRNVLVNKDMALLGFQFADATQAEAGALLACVVASEFTPSRTKSNAFSANAPRILEWLWRQGLYKQLSSIHQQSVIAAARSWPLAAREEFTRRFDPLPADFAPLVERGESAAIAETQSGGRSDSPECATPSTSTGSSPSAAHEAHDGSADASVTAAPPARLPKLAARELLGQLGEALREILSGDERLREEVREQRAAVQTAREKAVAVAREVHRAELATREAQAQREQEREQRVALEQEAQELRVGIERLRAEIGQARRDHGREAEVLAARIAVESDRSVDAFKNSLADKLRLEWRDFGDVRDLAMTAELGESLRRQLRGVFKVLERAGLAFKS